MDNEQEFDALLTSFTEGVKAGDIQEKMAIKLLKAACRTNKSSGLVAPVATFDEPEPELVAAEPAEKPRRRTYRKSK